MNSPRSHGTLEPLRSSYFLRCARRSFHREEFYSSRFFEVRRVSKMTRPSSGNAPSSAIEARGHCSGYCARGCIRNSRLRPLDVQTPDSDIFRRFVCAARRCRAVMSTKFDVVSAAAGFHLRSSAKYVTIHLFSSSRRASERETSAISPRRGGDRGKSDSFVTTMSQTSGPPVRTPASFFPNGSRRHCRTDGNILFRDTIEPPIFDGRSN